MDSCSPTKNVKTKIIELFSYILENQDEPVYYELIRGYISGASEDVRSYIKKTCKGEDLLKYFKRRPNYYNVSRHGEISLKSKQIPAVNYAGNLPETSRNDGDGNHLHETSCEGKENDSALSESDPHKSERYTEGCKTGSSESKNGHLSYADHVKSSAISEGLVTKKVTSKKEQVARKCDANFLKDKPRNENFNRHESSCHSKTKNNYHENERCKEKSDVTSSKCEGNNRNPISKCSVTEKYENQKTLPSIVSFELEEQVLSYFIDFMQKAVKIHYKLLQKENYPQNVKEFLSSNYPNDELLEFFKSHSEVFVTTENGFIMLQKAHIHVITCNRHKIQKKEVQNFSDGNCDSSGSSRSSSSSHTFTEAEHMSKSSQENMLDADESDVSLKIPGSVSHFVDESVPGLKSEVGINIKEITAVCFFVKVIHEKGPVLLQDLKDMTKSSPEILWCSKLKIGKFKKLLQNYPHIFVIKRTSSVSLCKGYEPKLKCFQEKIRHTCKEEQQLDEIFSECLSVSHTPDEREPEICKLPANSSKQDIPNGKSEQVDSSAVALCRSFETKPDGSQENVEPASYKKREYDEVCTAHLSASQIPDKRVPKIHLLPTDNSKHDIPNCKSEQDCHIKITTCFKPGIGNQGQNCASVHAANHSENDRAHAPEGKDFSAETGALSVQSCTNSNFKQSFSNTTSFIPKSILISEYDSNSSNSHVLPICNQNVSEENSDTGDHYAKCLVIWAADMLCMKIYETNKILEHNAKQKATDYFVSEIKNYFQRYVPYEYLKGKLGQAPPGISTFIKQKFPGSEFSKFFLEHKEFETLPAAVSLSKSYCDGSLKSLSDNNPLVSLGFQKLYDADFFKHFHAIYNSMRKLSSFMCNKQRVSMDRLFGYLSSLSSAEKNVLQSFEGQSTVEKTLLFLSYFDGVFGVCEKFIHLCKGYDVLLEALEKHILKRLICSLVIDGYSTIKILTDTIHTLFPHVFQSILNIENFIAKHSPYFAADCGNIMQKFCSFKNHKLSVEVLNLIEENLQFRGCLFYTELLSVIKASPQLFLDMIHEMPICLIYALKTNETFMCKEGKVFLRSHLEKLLNLGNGNCANSVDSNQNHEINGNALVLVTNTCCLKNGGEHDSLNTARNLLHTKFKKEFLVSLYRHKMESKVLTSVGISVVELELCYLNIPKLNCVSVIREIHHIAARNRKPIKKFIVQDLMCFLYRKFRQNYANLIFSSERLDNVRSKFLNFLNCLSNLKSSSRETSPPNKMTSIGNKTGRNELKGSLEKDISSTLLTVNHDCKPVLRYSKIWSILSKPEKTDIEPVLQYKEKSGHLPKPTDFSFQQINDLPNNQEKSVINGVCSSKNISERTVLDNDCIVARKTKNSTYKLKEKCRSLVTSSEVSFDFADKHNPSDYSPRTRIGFIVGFVCILSRKYGAVQVTCSSDIPYWIHFSKSVFLCAHQSFHEITLMDKMFCLVPNFDRKKRIWKACLVAPMCCHTEILSFPEIRLLRVEAIADANDEPAMSENGSLVQNHHDNTCDSTAMCGNEGEGLHDNNHTDSCVSVRLGQQEVFQHNTHASVLSHAHPTLRYDSADQLPTFKNHGLQNCHNNTAYTSQVCVKGENQKTHSDSGNIHSNNEVSVESCHQGVQLISHSNDIVSAVLSASQPDKCTSTQNFASVLNESCQSGSAEFDDDVTDSNKSVHAQPPDINSGTPSDAAEMHEAPSPDKSVQLSVRLQNNSLLSTDFAENTRHSVSHLLCDSSCQTISTGDIFSMQIYCDTSCQTISTGDIFSTKIFCD